MATGNPTPTPPAVQPVPIRAGTIAITEDGVDVLLTIVLHLAPDDALDLCLRLVARSGASGKRTHKERHGRPCPAQAGPASSQAERGPLDRRTAGGGTRELIQHFEKLLDLGRAGIRLEFERLRREQRIRTGVHGCAVDERIA
jgi:hypothetical protein